MKALAELLHGEMVRNGYFGANGRDDEAIAGLIGVVREWLSAMAQDQALADYDLWTEYQFLVKEAGKGLSA